MRDSVGATIDVASGELKMWSSGVERTGADEGTVMAAVMAGKLFFGGVVFGCGFT